MAPTRKLSGEKKKSGKTKRKSYKDNRKTRSKKQKGGNSSYYNIVQAIESGNSNILERLLKSKDASEYVNMDNGSMEGPPLVRATAYGDSTRDIKNILKAGADVNGKNNEDYTALMYASYDGKTDIVKTLLDSGADINAKNKDGDTALTLTISLLRKPEKRREIVSMLLDRGADVNAQDNVGRTALTIASNYGYADIVSILLEKGADVDAKTEYGETALSIANEFEYPEIVELIKNHIKNIKQENLRTTRLVTTKGTSKKDETPLMKKGQRDTSTIIADFLTPKGGYKKKKHQ